eukprot:gene1654-1751_t
MKSEVSSTSLTASSSPSIPSCMNVTIISTPSKDQRFLRDLSTIDDWIAKEGEGGIDIFGVVKNMKDFFTWRESEIKHGRLAMLAAFGWPVSELYHYKLSQSVGLMDFLAAGERAPSVLNGGLDNTYVLLGLGVFVAVGASLELQLLNRRKQQPDELQNFYNMWREDGWDAPGNYGFDPLQFSRMFCPTPRSKVYMQNIEIFNGRLAMLATVGYAIQEYVTGLPVVSETPQFFSFQ